MRLYKKENYSTSRRRHFKTWDRWGSHRALITQQRFSRMVVCFLQEVAPVKEKYWGAWKFGVTARARGRACPLTSSPRDTDIRRRSLLMGQFSFGAVRRQMD